jgi:hypothetical protein
VPPAAAGRRSHLLLLPLLLLLCLHLPQLGTSSTKQAQDCCRWQGLRGLQKRGRQLPQLLPLLLLLLLRSCSLLQ